jgi:hypothetical protein
VKPGQAERLRLSPEAEFRAIDEREGCVLHLERHTFFTTNAAGSLILSLLRRGATRAALVAAVRRRFRVSTEACAADVEAFLAVLTEAELLRARPPRRARRGGRPETSRWGRRSNRRTR